MAAFSDLPVEILEQIFEHLDDKNLYVIATVNHILNQVALGRLFWRYDIVRPAGILAGSRDMPSALYALHIAFWIKHVPALTITLSPWPNVTTQIRILTHFVNRLDFLGAFTLRLSGIGNRVPIGRGPSVLEETKLRKTWRKCFIGLLRAVLSKGSQSVSIFAPNLETPVYVKTATTPHLPRHWKLIDWLAEKGVRLISGASNADTVRLHRSRNTKVWGNAGLKTIQFSPMQMSPLFFWDTFGLLGAHVNTIHTIILDDISDTVFQRSHWGILLTRLQFPLLERFTLTTPGALRPLDPVFSFLNRHPTIIHLKLAGSQQWEPQERQGTPYLPNLGTLVAPNYLAVRILERPDNCRNLKDLQFYSRSPRLSVGSLGGIDICLGWTDDALAAVALHTLGPLRLVFWLQAVVDVGPWMSGRGNPRSLEIPPTLTQVHDITITLSGNPLRTAKFLLTDLPNWLGLFPVLERLHIDIDVMNKTALSAAIRNSCPRLKYLRIDFTIIPLS